MNPIVESVESLVRDVVHDKPRIRNALLETRTRGKLVHHSIAEYFPKLIKPRLNKMTVAITAGCNLRCAGCKYGRDFMVGHHLSLEMVKDIIRDGRAAGAQIIRLYGGEPLLHKDLPEMVRYSVKMGLKPYVTTNGILLGRKIDELFEAGLRDITLGFYGTGEAYNDYVGRHDNFQKLEDSLRIVREKYGDRVSMQLNFLIMRPSCNLESLHEAWDFAMKYNMQFRTDLVHYSLPYFTSEKDDPLQFRAEDRAAIEVVTNELLRLKSAHPDRILEQSMSLRSIPDWLLKGPDMHIPCDVYRMIWIGADGSVKLCYVTFDLGNLHDMSLADMLGSEAHIQATRDAFQLQCPNCHCERDHRVTTHAPSRRLYGD